MRPNLPNRALARHAGEPLLSWLATTLAKTHPDTDSTRPLVRDTTSARRHAPEQDLLEHGERSDVDLRHDQIYILYCLSSPQNDWH